jgi:hypothetical protein
MPRRRRQAFAQAGPGRSRVLGQSRQRQHSPTAAETALAQVTKSLMSLESGTACIGIPACAAVCARPRAQTNIAPVFSLVTYMLPF